MTCIALFHSVYGRRPAVLAAADLLRAAGHTVATPDLYAGRVAATADEGFALCDQIGWATIVQRARQALYGLPAETVLAGLSMGAAVAAGLLGERPATAGLLLHNTGGDGAAMRAGLPVQLHIADQDEYQPATEITAWEDAMTSAGATLEVFRYAGAGTSSPTPARPTTTARPQPSPRSAACGSSVASDRSGDSPSSGDPPSRRPAPRLASPRLASPRVASPRLAPASCRLASSPPRVVSPPPRPASPRRKIMAMNGGWIPHRPGFVSASWDYSNMCSPQQPARERVLAELARIDPAALGADALMREIKELAAFADQVHGELARLAGALDTAGRAAEGGHKSAATFVRSACGRTAGHASELVALARGLVRLPATAKALQAGQISADAALAITRADAQINDAEAAARAEEILLAAGANGATAADLQHLGEEIAYRADPDSADERERKRWERRHLSFGLTLDGTGILTGACGDTLSFETVRTAAEAFAPPGGTLDTRTAAQRRLDGLVAACRIALDTATAPIRHGAAPHITVLVHDHTLAQAARATAQPDSPHTPATTGAPERFDTPERPGVPETPGTPKRFGAADTSTPPDGGTRPGAGAPPGSPLARGAPPARTGHGSMLTARQVLTLCCSAEITAIRWADGLPLDVGRASRTETPALRRAIHARDLTCRWPGCDTPAQWCTAHHIRGWVNGATTCLTEMVLLYHLHHSYFIHQLGWTITGDPNATVYFHHPEGWLTLESPLPGRPRPP